MLDDRALRAADPVANWRVDPRSAQAQALLATILTSPRGADAPKAHRRFALQHPARHQRMRRVVVGAAAIGTAAAVGVIAPALWDSGPGQPAAAYAVTTKPDGSVELLVRWNQLTDPTRLSAALRNAGVPTVITTGQPKGNCGTEAERSQAYQAFSKAGNPPQPQSLEGYVMRPSLFPPDTTLVISSYDESWQDVVDLNNQYHRNLPTPVHAKSHNVVLYLAPKNSTSCTLGPMWASATIAWPTPYPTDTRTLVPQPTS